MYKVHHGVKKKTRKMSQVHLVVLNIRFLLVLFGQATGIAQQVLSLNRRMALAEVGSAAQTTYNSSRFDFSPFLEG